MSDPRVGESKMKLSGNTGMMSIDVVFSHCVVCMDFYILV